MRFTLTVELGNDAIETGAELAELLIRIAPTVECCVGTDLADCMGTVRNLNGKSVGNWTCIEPKLPDTGSLPHPIATSNQAGRLTVREINAHLSEGLHACYVNIDNQLIRIRHAREVNGRIQGKSVNRPGEWITIPPEAKFELVE